MRVCVLALVGVSGLLGVACNAILGAEEPVVVGLDAAAGAAAAAGSDPADSSSELVEVGESSFTPKPQADYDTGLPPPVCGDGIISPPEQCDDGNAVGGDGCSGCLVECEGVRELLQKTSMHCYRFGATELAWDAADAECKAWGGALAAIQSNDEYGLATERFENDTWVGGKREQGEKFSWVTGEPWDYSNWAPGQPGSLGDCVFLLGTATGFAVGSCEVAKSFLCERPPAGKR